MQHRDSGAGAEFRAGVSRSIGQRGIFAVTRRSTLIERLEPRTFFDVSLVKDINTQPGPLLGLWNMVAADNGTVYIAAEDSTAGWELYKSDGTSGGTTLVKDVRP